MTPEILSAAQWSIGGLIGLILWFIKREINQVNEAVARKADKEQMQRENEVLKMDLKELRDRRDSDLERIERANAERFNTFSESMRDRLSTMERNVDAKLDMIKSDMSDKLDMVMDAIKQVRKEQSP